MPRDFADITPAMMTSCQKTLAHSVSCSGTTVHCGQIVNLTIHPAKANHGIVFERLDKPAPHNLVPALWDKVRVSPLCTQIVNDAGTDVRTIEHLMAALYASGIDNAHITLDGPEVPILDGSAAPFFAMLRDAGEKNMAAPRRFLKILKTIEVKDGDAYARFEPSNAPAFAISVAYPHHHVGNQTHALNFDETDFSEIAAARTFGFMREIEMLRAKGLTLGGSLDNAIVIDNQGGVMNPEGYRYDNELARHKLLDAIGDISLAGLTVIGKFTGNRSGHALNNQLLHALFAHASAAIEISSESPALIALRGHASSQHISG